jgi:AAHS family 4-hydroxybenzoate transporter-like MFS transporter
MKQASVLDVRHLIDQHPLSRFQLSVAVLCGAIAFMDGFDAQAMGYVAPALIGALHLARSTLGPLISIGLVGMMIGALTFGLLADRFGRKPVLVFCILMFGAMSLITATATSVETLRIFRLLTGFGLGGAMPNTIALTSEYMPKRSRATAVMTMFCGFSIGAAAGGFIAAALISRFGWQAVFVVGGSIPLVMSIITIAFLPESIRFLLLKGGHQKQVEQYLSRISTRLPPYDEISAGEEKASANFAVKELFAEGRARITPLLWLMFFMTLLNLYFLQNWLPTVMSDAGIKIETAIMITTLFQIAGVAGTILLGRLMDKHNKSAFKILAAAYLGAAVSIFLIGESGVSIAMLIFTVSAAGFCVVGGQTASNALAADYYPTSIRSTGVGWCLGIGRVGGIIGPIVAGVLLTFGGGARRVFWVAAIPALIGTIAAFAVAVMRDINHIGLPEGNNILE